jgi:hypothetical protein
MTLTQFGNPTNPPAPLCPFCGWPSHVWASCPIRALVGPAVRDLADKIDQEILEEMERKWPAKAKI